MHGGYPQLRRARRVPSPYARYSMEKSGVPYIIGICVYPNPCSEFASPGSVYGLGRILKFYGSYAGLAANMHRISARGLKLVISDAFVPVFLQFCLRVGANVKRRAYFSDVSKIAHLLHPEARLSIYYSPVFESNRCLLPATSVD